MTCTNGGADQFYLFVFVRTRPTTKIKEAVTCFYNSTSNAKMKAVRTCFYSANNAKSIDFKGRKLQFYFCGIWRITKRK